MINLIKLVVAVGCLGVAVVAGLAAWRVFDPRFVGWNFFQPIVISMVVGMVVGSFRLVSGFFRTLEHELTHVLFGMLCLKPPRHMLVTQESGGEAGFAGRTNWLISLSPYFFPLTAVALAGLALIVVETLWAGVGKLIFAALGYHFGAVAAELRVGQTDLSRHGNLFSACFILGLGVPICAVLFAYAGWGVSGVSLWFESVVRVRDWVG